MSIDLTTYGKRDQKVIRENPGKDVYALKELGLTDRGFERLLSEGYDGSVSELTNKLETEYIKTNSESNTKVSIPSAIEIIEPSNIVKPTVKKVDNLPKPLLSEPQRISAKGGNIRVQNLKTGKIVEMKPKAAQRLLKFHKEFQQV